MVTGITGQDGSFLADLLIEHGYHVTGLIRTASGDRLGASEHLRGRIDLVRVDLLDSAGLATAVAANRPDELYHLAAPSFIPDSWRDPEHTHAAIAGSTAALLQAVRDHSDQTRVFVAGSGAIFGDAPESPQREDTPCRPETPYAVAKLAAHRLVGQVRAQDGVFACSGILYNHESERRPRRFVTRKITRAAAAIKTGLEHELVLGDLSPIRDWSFAGDVVRGAWLMLQQERPGDYIIASGVGHTVRQFVDVAFDYVGLKAEDHVRVEESLQRPAEVTPPVGDPSRAREILGWKPTLSFEQLIHRMVDADLRRLRLPTRSGAGADALADRPAPPPGAPG
jgi:GDPmannose 4,6-dehydratase